MADALATLGLDGPPLAPLIAARLPLRLPLRVALDSGGWLRLGWLPAAASGAMADRPALRQTVRAALADLLAHPAVQPPPPAPRRTAPGAAGLWLAWSHQDTPPHRGTLLGLASQPLGLDIQHRGLVPAPERAGLIRDFLGGEPHATPYSAAALSDAAFNHAWVTMEACDKALRRGLREASPAATRERQRCRTRLLSPQELQGLGLPATAALDAALAWCDEAAIPHETWG
ncbi:hypothetical protein [Amphibiibacter pelophylacis]|uniref:Uncharacterized protein n=1 Tax=Amphibiibacter pelophylacis TaxID=1799477 RepID=A0ACC6P1A4_9BURK